MRPLNEYRAQLKSKAICYICGETAGVNPRRGDHLPPESLIKDHLQPHQMFKVPCCRRCNNLFSATDGTLSLVFSKLSEDAISPPEPESMRPYLRIALNGMGDVRKSTNRLIAAKVLIPVDGEIIVDVNSPVFVPIVEQFHMRMCRASCFLLTGTIAPIKGPFHASGSMGFRSWPDHEHVLTTVTAILACGRDDRKSNRTDVEYFEHRFHKHILMSATICHVGDDVFYGMYTFEYFGVLCVGRFTNDPVYIGSEQLIDPIFERILTHIDPTLPS